LYNIDLNDPKQQPIVIQESNKMDTGTIVGIVVGIAVAATALGLIIWIFTKKKSVKKAGKQGKKYKKSTKLEYVKCIVQPKNWVSPGNCHKPVKSNPSPSTQAAAAAPRQVITNDNIQQVLA
jgi:hypothetical protein